MRALTLALLLPTLAFAASSEDAKVKLGAPGLSYVNLPQDRGDFFNDQFAANLEQLGMRVVTAQQIQALLGSQRQKAILGCQSEAESAACLVELANALGVDGLVTGSIGKFGNSYQLNIVIVDSRDGSMLGSYSGRADGEKALLDLLGTAARNVAPEVGNKLHKPVITYPHQQISANLIGTAATLGHLVNLEYERVLTDHWTLFAAPELLIAGATALDPYGTNSTAAFVFFTAGARWYPRGPAPAGLFWGAHVHMMSGFASLNVPGAVVFSGGFGGFGLGVEVGYSWTFWHSLYLSLGAGVGVDYTIATYVGATEPTQGALPLPSARANIGWAF